MLLGPFRSRCVSTACLLLVCSSAVLFAQYDDPRTLHAGSVIVAAPDYEDQVYGQSVILLTHYGPDGAAGIMLNRKTPLPISKALPESSLSTALYLGGPISSNRVLTIVQSPSILSQASQVSGDLFVISDQALLEQTLARVSGQFHSYLGHCEWGPGVLEDEVADGGWYIFTGRSQQVFDEKPESLWERLVRLTTSLRAGLSIPSDLQ